MRWKHSLERPQQTIAQRPHTFSKWFQSLIYLHQWQSLKKYLDRPFFSQTCLLRAIATTASSVCAFLPELSIDPKKITRSLCGMGMHDSGKSRYCPYNLSFPLHQTSQTKTFPSRTSRTLLTMQILKGVFLFLPSLSIFHVSANEVAPYSNCSSLCIYHPDDDITDPKATEIGPQDIVCHDWELNGPNSTSAGRRFHNCTKCLSTSEAQFSDPPYESDPYWFLCLFADS